MKEIKVKTPAKINLTLEILNKRQDNFHNIQSIMQTINLYDYITLNFENSNNKEITLNGTSDEIPYDINNIAYKASQLFFDKINLKNYKLNIYIEKNIPVCAGLAGGSSNAAGVLVGLNEMFDFPLTNEEINILASKLGSDLNFCLLGGTALATSRGEIVEKLPSVYSDVSLIKPKNLSITAKEAYTRYASFDKKIFFDYTMKLKSIILQKNIELEKYLFNSLELPLLETYNELMFIKSNVKNSLMSGSGATFFCLKKTLPDFIKNENFLVFENLKFVDEGAKTF